MGPSSSTRRRFDSPGCASRPRAWERRPSDLRRADSVSGARPCHPAPSGAAPSGGRSIADRGLRVRAFDLLPPRRRLALFTTGYLLVWASAGVVAFALGALIARLAASDPALGIGADVVAYVGCGLNQLSPIKDRCLQHCRSPLSLFFHYSLFQGRLRDLRVGAHHGADCLGCCWALRVVTEKPWSRGERFSRLVGIASLALAVATIWFPVLAAGFSPMM